LNASARASIGPFVKHRYEFLVMLFFASCADSAKPPTTVSRETTGDRRTSTEVSVTQTADAQPNAVCASYCRQISACWLTLSNADPMVAPADAERRCLLEQSNCQRPTADLHCCGKLSDCREFSHCIETSKNVLSACNEPVPGPSAATR
jgi:hypothetical protein